MQDTKNNATNLEFVRVYPPGVKRLGKKIQGVLKGCDDSSGINGDNNVRSPTLYKIDLPFQDFQTNATQALGQNSIVLPMPVPERKSESYDACGLQSKLSGELLLNHEYSNMKNVSSDTRISLQDTHSELCRDELRDTAECIGGPTRVMYASQNTVGLGQKCNPCAESNINKYATCMEIKMRNSGRRKSPNTKKLNRPQHQIIKFLEDYTEFGADLKEMFEGRGKHCHTILESTLDGSIVKGARRFVVYFSSKM